MTVGTFFASHLGELICMACLLVASGFFSGSETALFNLTRGQVHRLRNKHGPASSVVMLMSRPGRTLHTLLLCNLLVNVAYSGISAVLILSLPSLGLSAGWTVAASLAPLLVLIMVGEVMPKMLAYALAEHWAIPSAAPVRVIVKVLSIPLQVLDTIIVDPLTRVVAGEPAISDRITADELGLVLDLSAKRGIISPDTNALLQEVVELTDLRVSDIMVPRVDMVAYDVDDPPEGLMELFRKTHLRRIPLYAGELDNIVGMVHAKRLVLQPNGPLRELAGEVIYAPEMGNIERLLLQLRTKRTQTVIVVDEYGGTAGLVTLQDVLEEIVGDLPEPGEIEPAPPVEQIDRHTYLISADLSIRDWAEAFGIDLSGRRINTIGGFVTSLLGRIAQMGDQTEYHNLRFTVESMRRRRIDKLRIELLDTDDIDGEAKP